MTSLAYFFTMEKALVKIIFGRKFFIHQPIFKILVALFYDFWDAKKLDQIKLEVFQDKVICKKAVPK